MCAQAALGSLSSLARTSTGFMNPALNALWKHQGTIVHLLRCMPEDLWDITVTQPAYDDPLEETNVTIVSIQHVFRLNLKIYG